MITIKVRDIKGVTVMDLEGRIDIDASEFIETVGWLLKNNKSRILCNFENVELVDYSGLSILAIAYKNVTNHNSIMKFCNVSIHIRELFRIVQMDKVLLCYDNEKQAILNFDEKILELENKHLRRRFKRLEMNIKVKYCSKKTKSKNEVYEGTVVNISGVGLLMSCRHPLPVKTPLSLEIFLPEELVPVEMEGMVIWVVEKKLQPCFYPGMGVQFIKIDSEKQKELVGFIEKNITHRSET